MPVQVAIMESVPWGLWLAVAIGSALALYLGLVAALLVAGRREEARALAGFVPDCVVLVGRLLRDRRVPRRYKLLLACLVGYLAVPFDLVPDFIPVAGQLDDVLIVALVLRVVVRGSGRSLVEAHWPGPQASLELVLRAAGLSRGGTPGSPTDPLLAIVSVGSGRDGAGGGHAPAGVASRSYASRRAQPGSGGAWSRPKTEKG